MKNKILLGYEVKTGKEVYIKLSHLVATGLTAESGKTTALNALIKRSGLRAVMFKTKGNEQAITEGTIIPPYFKENSHWQYVSSLLEATLKEKLKFERSWIMQVCKGTNSLLEVKNNIDEKLANEKLNQLSKSVYITLQEYFKLILPQLQTTVFSNSLELREGINVMDLEYYSDEIQSLVIRSTLETILKEYKGVVAVIPEFWKFAHQKRGNPVKEIAEQFIRQGATKRDYLWADSQDMANVDKTLLKQVFTWILGLQTEINEVKHTISEIPLSKNKKPKPEDIMTLKLGHFYLATPEETVKVYVLPSWLDEKTGEKIAKGKMNVSDVEQPTFIAPYTILSSKSIQIPEQKEKPSGDWKKEVMELRTDFFNRLIEANKNNHEYMNKLAEQIFKLQSQKPVINEEEIVMKVLQKLPTPSIPSVTPVSFDKESIIREVLARVPSGGMKVYKVAPLEKIKKDFLEEAKNKILSDISSINDKSKKILKYLESRGVGLAVNEICMKALLYPNGTGGYSKIVNDSMKELSTILVAEKQTNGKCFGRLKQRISFLLKDNEATEQEIENVYNHILAEMLNSGVFNMEIRKIKLKDNYVVLKKKK